MLKVAERGIDQIIQLIDHMKQLAIDAANDSNTDEDRRTIQKEFDQRAATINDIAIGTEYNGKRLLDGTWARKTVSVGEDTGGLPPVDNTTVHRGANTTVTNLIGNFSASFAAVPSDVMVSAGGQGIPVTSSFKSQQEDDWSHPLWSWTKAWNASNPNNPTNINTRFFYAVNLDFSGMKYSSPLPAALHEQGFNILCGTCPQYISIIFDASKTAVESTYDPNPPSRGAAFDPKEFVIGVKDVLSADDLAKAVFDGVQSLSSTVSASQGIAWGDTSGDAILMASLHSIGIAKNPEDPTKYLLLKSNSHLQFLSGTIPSDPNEPIPEPESPEPKSSPFVTTKFNPLWIQHGTQSGQRIHVYINSMRTEALKGTIPNEADKAQLAALDYDSTKQAELQSILNAAKNMTLDDAKVTTVDNAKIAIRVVEGALEYALNEATTQGAYLQRLEFTDSNVTIMGENVQQAESTIRDADMAREMAEYTKYNILTQSSQAMLAQSNQNQSSILSLLQ